MSDQVKDLVCNMDVDPKKALKKTYKGKDYYFCGPSCEWAFDNDPKQFINKK